MKSPRKSNRVSYTTNHHMLALIAIGLLFCAGLATAASIETFPAGDRPYGLAFDGANIWAADFNGDTVTKLRASDGALLGTFSAGDAPTYLAYDGSNIWVSDYYGASVTELRASDGALLGTF